ncbi:MAG: hypothetical protein IJN71_06825, partial [Oscillospiraceae bacterium]|nr:hypothetical protein [Oscillospiraceae bacterium]
MKKILSLILAVAMLVGFAPSTFGEVKAANATEGYEFLFTHDAHTTTADVADDAVSHFEESGRDIIHTIRSTNTLVSDKWGYVAQSFPYTTAGVGTQGDYTRVSYYRPSKKAVNQVTFNPDSTETATALCFEIEISEKGTYRPKFEFYGYPQGPIVELYLVPKDGKITDGTSLSAYVKKLNTKYRIGIVDTYTSALDSTGFEVMRDITLDAGNYYFIMVPNGESAAAAKYSQDGNKTFHYFLP